MTSILVVSWEHLSAEKIKKCKADKIIMIESYAEASVHKHHKKKLVFYISAIRHFYEEIKGKLDVEYIKTDLGIAAEVSKYLADSVDEVMMIRPGEYRLYADMDAMCKKAKVKFTMVEDTQFVCTIDEMKSWASKYKSKLLMENFYHEMRKKTGILMDDGAPAGGKWNFDKDNRKSIETELKTPHFEDIKADAITRDVIELVQERFGDHFGDIEPFWLETTAAGAEKAFADFVKKYLPNFGPYQDAMQSGEELIFHSAISSYLNIGFLDPLAVCKAVEDAYRKDRVSVQSAEGFIRQILGWREFIRGIYWMHMPEYAELNAMGYKNNLPGFYWDAKTDMNCIRQVVEFTKKYGYSHHIQRLMITGNFAALIEVEPKQICEWYLCVYTDAYEWVEMPNTLGMATYSDGGIVGTKPYVASAAYINRMSNFCKGCRYKHADRDGPDACPFNCLYWNYLIKHEEKLRKNPRIGVIYGNVDRMDDKAKEKIQSRASEFIKKASKSM